MLSDSEKRQLDECGYLVLPGLMGRELLCEVRERVEELLVQEGVRAGSEFKQEPHARGLANLVDKGEVFERVPDAEGAGLHGSRAGGVRRWATHEADATRPGGGGC
jgi:hypothetical protein